MGDTLGAGTFSHPVSAVFLKLFSLNPHQSVLSRGPGVVWRGLALLLLIGSLGACERPTTPPDPPSDAALGRDFLPVEVGRFWEYDVTEVQWNFNDSSVARYQLRERVDTVYAGADGEPTYRVVRARRATAGGQWRDEAVFALVRTTQLVRRTLANIPTVELMFPVREGLTWNPNLFNDLDSTERRYTDLDQPLALPDGRQFARTVRVVDMGEDNLINRREDVSVYARSVGRVRRVHRALEFCQENDIPSTGCSPGPGYIVRGNEREETLRDYGPR